MKQRKPGTVPANRIPIIDKDGNVRGHVGRTAGQPTVHRLLGSWNAKLGKHKGRTAWIEQRK